MQKKKKSLSVCSLLYILKRTIPTSFRSFTTWWALPVELIVLWSLTLLSDRYSKATTLVVQFQHLFEFLFTYSQYFNMLCLLLEIGMAGLEVLAAGTSLASCIMTVTH